MLILYFGLIFRKPKDNFLLKIFWQHKKKTWWKYTQFFIVNLPTIKSHSDEKFREDDKRCRLLFPFLLFRGGAWHPLKFTTLPTNGPWGGPGNRNWTRTQAILLTDSYILHSLRWGMDIVTNQKCTLCKRSGETNHNATIRTW